MNPKISLTKLIGLPQVDGWSQILSIGNSPQVIVLFSIYGQQAKNVGRDLEELVAEAVPSNAATLYSLLTKMARVVAEKDCQLSAVLGFLESEKMVLAALRGGIVLRRDGKVGLLLQADQEIKMLEGKLMVEDKIVFLSQLGWQFKEDLFQKLSQGWDIESIVTSLTNGVHTLDNSSLMAFAFVEYRLDANQAPEAAPVMPAAHSALPFLSVEEVTEEPTSEAAPPAASHPGFNFKDLFLGKVVPLFKKLGASILSLGKKLLSFFKKGGGKLKNLTAIIFSKREYLNSSQIKKKTIRIGILIGIGVLVVVAILGGVWGWRQNQLSLARQDLSPILEEKVQAQEIAASNPIEARSMAQQVISELEAKSKKFEQQYFAQKLVNKELAAAVEFLNSISGQEQVHDLSVFYDLQEHFPQFIGTKISYAHDQLAILDPEKSELVLIDVNSRQGKLVQLQGTTKPRDLVLEADKAYLLDQDKILSVDLESGATTELISDENLSDVSQIAVYLDHIYALNPDKRNVFKFAYDNGEYSDPTRWVRSAPGVEFDQLSAIQVDGSVWLAGRQGSIYKLAANQLQDWSVSGLPSELSGRILLYVQADLDSLYLLEPSQQRLVVLNRAGQFVKEISSADLAAASGVVVTADERQALVISGSLVFSIALE